MRQWLNAQGAELLVQGSQVQNYNIFQPLLTRGRGGEGKRISTIQQFCERGG